jgi:Cytotoxic translational repressor of toxin-antitoxin stability system
MADKIRKALDGLSPKERKAIDDLLVKIKNGQFDGLDWRKLKGRDGIYRVRKGEMRIIYRLNASGGVVVLEIGRRNDITYNF